jgi:hypothetical protein
MQHRRIHLREGPIRDLRHRRLGIAAHHFEQVDEVERLEGESPLRGHDPHFERHTAATDLVDERVAFAFSHGCPCPSSLGPRAAPASADRLGGNDLGQPLDKADAPMASGESGIFRFTSPRLPERARRAGVDRDEETARVAHGQRGILARRDLRTTRPS